MIASLATPADLLRVIAIAKTIALSAYVLPANSAVVRALEAAADAGTHVAVTLDGAPYFGAASKDSPNPNVGCAEALRAHGATVRLSDVATERPMHLKAAVIDGRAYLDDRNWATSGRATIVETHDPVTVRAIADAIDGRPVSQNDLALQKSAALALEAATIRNGTGDCIDVATETFGSSIVSEALCDRARSGATVRLAVNAHVLAGDARGRERAALARLSAAGVSVRAVVAAEKYALSGDSVWLGSANATSNDGGMLDWGLCSVDPSLARALASAFEAGWSHGTVIAPRSSLGQEA